jgi:glycosyltransferase involved in cell wall biosynthesis
MKPIVSIVLPTFNRLEWLPPTISSVSSQTLESWELIIIDDGSEEETRQYLRSLHAPPKVRVIFSRHTGKPGVLRNLAVRSAEADIIAFMDSDDLWEPDKLRQQVDSLRRHSECSWGLTKFNLIDRTGKILQVMPAKGGWVFTDLVTAQLVIALPSVIAYRDFFQSVGGFDERLTMTEDYDLWLRMAALSRVDVLDEVLTVVRRHGNHFGNPVVGLEDSIRVLGRYINSTAANVPVRTVRRLYAGYCARLAVLYAAAGKRPAAMAVLKPTTPDFLSRLWIENAAKALMLVFLPKLLVATLKTAVRSFRRVTALHSHRR